MSVHIYANSGISAENRSAKSKKSIEDIYVNEDAVDTQVARSHKGTPTSGHNPAWGGCSRVTIVCVLLLCILLITAIAVLWSKLITEKNLSKQLKLEREELQVRLDALDLQDKLRWTHFGSNLYYFVEKKNWTESRQDCREKGGDLVIINSKEKQEFIMEQLQGSQAWIGLSDKDTEGTWTWVDGTPLTTGYWGTHQPDNYKNEDCAEIGFLNKGDWNDRPCLYKQGWICEKSVKSV